MRLIDWPFYAASRTCQLTGKKANNGYVVTFSHKRNKKLQGANLQYKRLFWPEEKRWVRMRISTKAMKTVEKRGLQVMAKEAGIDLYSLPYVDARPERQEWLAQQPRHPPMVSARLRTVSHRRGNSVLLCTSEGDTALSVLPPTARHSRNTLERSLDCS
ncbi:hypothetical protein COCSUDRAFT_13362 [Coccomyxa subellipsoidea C-169]|uniref:Large ribosomal subunit protein bL28c n=1 Tax=Coccomyxa subellipsoidea (strain C-169) TaxID=574566 RepID=I0Z3D3_COCSC|nr:hypothetical protein COCSUDRAFT_13362 [Coccomyxa subellipsoidea C-169]EIE25152.1 hypothetical protein COCSUDRAFT_13362 [Coccomyxa subellipsoidea C-169]|eukprot:XP_005649696.1 hypothetical protein COCSUDRAFT_13362 [Coccomyxa subellipsoidea C-169]